MSWPGIRVERLRSDAPLFRIAGAGRDIFYTPGRVAFNERALDGEARVVEERWRAARRPREPECLTLNLSNRCNLGCSYCYSAGERDPNGAVLDMALVESAAWRVARACAAKGQPLRLVVHGGGEPTLHAGLLEQIVRATRRIAADCGAGWHGYIATNGQMDEGRARWLAREFDQIGISCDGPPEFQDRQRPRVGGAASSTAVAATVRAIQSVGGRFNLRATITPEGMARQTGIAQWLAESLGAREIRFEPVYRPGGASWFRPADALPFATAFLAAQRAATAMGSRLTTSGVRLDELHGPYCNPRKGVLHLLPDGREPSCPWVCGNAGDADPEPERCHACLNVYHCARECPETCAPNGAPGFRCLLYQLLSEAWIVEAAGLTIPQAEPYPLAARKLPAPVWQRRGFDDSGAGAWERLAKAPASTGALSVYAHVPFCDYRCACCDCYSVPLRGGGEFAVALRREIDSWAALPGVAERPVTTVHFGGGTPTCLPAADFDSIVARIRERLHTTADTEWAIESTTSGLTPERLAGLRQAGFTRLHIGVQSLEPEARRFFGRRETPELCLNRISQALELGFIVSVDLVYGMPPQTVDGWLAGIETLAAAGAHGFSLYQLQITPRNRRYLEARGFLESDVRRDWTLFEAAHDRLLELGYRKNHFAHFAKPPDRNLYYNHAARGEDLLALGPSADGIVGDYRYRRQELPAWLASPFPQGGIAETGWERRIRIIAARLMCGRLDVQSPDLDLRPLAGRWTAAGLLDPGAGLTARGSWFIGVMLDELERLGGGQCATLASESGGRRA